MSEKNSGFDPNSYTDEFDPNSYVDPKDVIGIMKRNGEKAAGALWTGVENAGNTVMGGYLPQISTITQPAVDRMLLNPAPAPWSAMLPGTKEYLAGRDETIKQMAEDEAENPNAAFLGKGVGMVTSAMLPFDKAMKAKTAAQAVAASGLTSAVLGLASNPGDKVGNFDPIQAKPRAWNALLAGALGTAIPATLVGISKIGEAPEALAQKVLPPAPESYDGKIVSTADGVIDQSIPQAVDNQEVLGAAKRLGVHITPGMASDDYITKGLEASLSKSPSFVGNIVRKDTDRAWKGVVDNAEKFVAEKVDNTATELGEAVVSGMKDRILKRYRPIQELYDKFSQSAQNIPLRDKSKNQVALNIINYAEETFAPGTTQRSLLLEKADQLAAATSVDQLKQIKTSLRKQIKNLPPDDRYSFSDIFVKLERMEKTSVFRAAVEAAASAPEGRAIAKELLATRKAADSGYRDLMGILGETADRSGISKGRTVTEFLDDFEHLDGAEVGAKLTAFFDKNSGRGLKLMTVMKKEFPEAFEVMRVQKLNDIYAKSLDSKTKVFSPHKMLKQIEDLEPEMQQLLIGSQRSKVKDLRTLIGSIPEPANPSKTAIEMAFQNSYDPKLNMADALRYGMYKNGMLPRLSKYSKEFQMKAAPAAGRWASRPITVPPTQLLEGYNVRELTPIDAVEADKYRGQIATDQSMDSVKRARMLNLLNKHGYVPMEYAFRQFTNGN
jgi:hypothetical protein